MPTRPAPQPTPEPAALPKDEFATSFDVHDWEDWFRLTCWVEVVEPNGDGGKAMRRPAASLVIPRSSLHGLMSVLRHSAGHQREAKRRHS